MSRLTSTCLAGALASLIVYVLLPANFPNHGTDDSVTRTRPRFSWQFLKQSLKRLDLIGAALLIAASILVVVGFEEAGPRHPWDSPVILSTLIVGLLLFVAFILFERRIDRPNYLQEPVFPLRLLKSRAFVGLIVCVPHLVAMPW
jgi:hypothetical protein